MDDLGLLDAGERLPDYAGGDLTALVGSVAASVGAPGRPGLRDAVLARRLASRERTLLWLVDGLGVAQLERARLPALAAHVAGEVTSVFPSATASAITTLMTARPPRAHGVTGWRVRLPSLATTIAPLPFRADEGRLGRRLRERAVEQLFRQPPWWQQLPAGAVHLVMPRPLTEGPYTETHAGAAQLHGFDALHEGIEAAARLLDRSSTRFVYLYWPQFDHLAHANGSCGPKTLAHLSRIDECFEALVGACSARDANVVVTADHGFTDTAAEDWLDVDSQPRFANLLAHPLTGEPRAAFAHLRAGVDAVEFRAAVADAFGERVRAVESAALVGAGWFGAPPDAAPRLVPGPAPAAGLPAATLLERVGHFALLPRGRACLHHGEGKGEAPMIGIHGGLHPEEMAVPVVLAQP